MTNKSKMVRTVVPYTFMEKKLFEFFQINSMMNDEEKKKLKSSGTNIHSGKKLIFRYYTLDNLELVNTLDGIFYDVQNCRQLN